MLLQLVRTGALRAFGGKCITATNGMSLLPTPSAEEDARTLGASPYPEGTTPEHELLVNKLAGAGTGGSVPDIKVSNSSGTCLGVMDYAMVAAQNVG
ncbi:hypothetical protein CVT25_008515 [Psilocybe cyanescens]|uniref:Uncharacterized protein n=1 Tax=Psilocybe cyanescens TaxID=93625 RepID=A0A409XNH0_PSICY|nr:hypothetical protein CVT25_008515 [Psilocybe cyanescens]